jgi:hypothetical protein
MLTMRLLASLLRTWHLLVPANTDWFVVNILCHSRGTYLHGDCCFSDLVLYNSKSTLIIKRQRILIVPLVSSNSSIYNIAENLLFLPPDSFLNNYTRTHSSSSNGTTEIC